MFLGLCLLGMALVPFLTFHTYLVTANYTTIEFLEKRGCNPPPDHVNRCECAPYRHTMVCAHTHRDTHTNTLTHTHDGTWERTRTGCGEGGRLAQGGSACLLAFPTSCSWRDGARRRAGHACARGRYDAGVFSNITAVYGRNPLFWLLPVRWFNEGDGLSFDLNPEWVAKNKLK